MRNILILLNICLYLYFYGLNSAEAEVFVNRYGFVGKQFSLDPVKHSYTFITYQFLHGSIIHIIGNMLYLYVFGHKIESNMGSRKFLIFYIFSGTISCMIQMIAVPQYEIPLLGASGSIAGILGIYAALFPKAKILTFIPFGIFGWFFKIPALVFLCLWFLFQFLLGYLSKGLFDISGGIAWWAHVGGFIFGMLFGMTIK